MRANPLESNWGIFVHSGWFSSNSFTLIRIDKKYNLYPVLITLMKHRLLVSSCHFLSFLVFLSFFFSLSLYKHSQVSVPCRESFLTTSRPKQCGVVMKIFTVTYKSIQPPTNRSKQVKNTKTGRLGGKSTWIVERRRASFKMSCTSEWEQCRKKDVMENRLKKKWNGNY